VYLNLNEFQNYNLNIFKKNKIIKHAVKIKNKNGDNKEKFTEPFKLNLKFSIK
jgi:hypothetical protein